MSDIGKNWSAVFFFFMTGEPLCDILRDVLQFVQPPPHVGRALGPEMGIFKMFHKLDRIKMY